MFVVYIHYNIVRCFLPVRHEVIGTVSDEPGAEERALRQRPHSLSG